MPGPARYHAPMRRRLFTLCTALSLLLCVAVCVLWVRSYWRNEYVIWSNGDPIQRVSIQVSSGAAKVTWARYVPNVELDEPWLQVYSSPKPYDLYRDVRDSTEWHRTWMGFVYGGEDWQFRKWLRCVVLPLWFPFVVFFVPPALWLMSRHSRYRRHRLGLCVHCGYDLRASPGRCPECGAERGRG